MLQSPADSPCRQSLRVLKQGAGALGVALDARAERRFVDYCELLERTGAHTNLTALRTPLEMMRGLFLDSLTLVNALPRSLVQARGAGTSLVDVGSGAGVPGAPLKIALPGLRLTLVESIGKKATFLRELSAVLDLSDTEVAAARAEVAARDQAMRDGNDLCVARAVAALPTLIELCAPFVKSGGLLLFPKSGAFRSEISAAGAAAEALGVELIDVLPVPESLELGAGHVNLVYRKLRPTSDRFPRPVGVPAKSPLRSRRAEGSESAV